MSLLLETTSLVRHQSVHVETKKNEVQECLLFAVSHVPLSSADVLVNIICSFFLPPSLQSPAHVAMFTAC